MNGDKDYSKLEFTQDCRLCGAKLTYQNTKPSNYTNKICDSCNFGSNKVTDLKHWKDKKGLTYKR